MAKGKPEDSGAGIKKLKLQVNLKSRRLLMLLVIVALVAGAGYFAYQYTQFKKDLEVAQKDLERLSNPQEVAKTAAAELVRDVGQLAQLPEGETPTIATVSDVSKLQNQAFFAKAQNGDKVLIYTQAKRAYLYRPSTNKLIEIAPISIGDNTSNDSSSNNSTSKKTAQ